MVQAIKKRVRVGAGGTIAVQDPALPEGAEAEVIVLLGEAVPAKEVPPLASMLGAARGLFASPEEIDEYIRDLRDEWD